MNGLNKVKDVSTDLLEDGFDIRISTLGLSMYPLIRTGDKITIGPGKNFEIGDIVLFNRDDQLVCHRLVKAYEKSGIKYYQTRGDSFFGLDEPVTVEQILGKVVRIERENVSFPRRILLFMYPAMRFAGINALVISALILIRNILTRNKPG